MSSLISDFAAEGASEAPFVLSDWLKKNKLESIQSTFEQRQIDINEVMEFNGEDLQFGRQNDLRREEKIYDVVCVGVYVCCTCKMEEMGRKKNETGVDELKSQRRVASVPQDNGLSWLDDQSKERNNNNNNNNNNNGGNGDDNKEKEKKLDGKQVQGQDNKDIQSMSEYDIRSVIQHITVTPEEQKCMDELNERDVMVDTLMNKINGGVDKLDAQVKQCCDVIEQVLDKYIQECSAITEQMLLSCDRIADDKKVLFFQQKDSCSKEVDTLQQ
ncbi:Vacuolar sorting protein VPS9, partial [Reticulomyxa filosa]